MALDQEKLEGFQTVADKLREETDKVFKRFDDEVATFITQVTFVLAFHTFTTGMVGNSEITRTLSSCVITVGIFVVLAIAFACWKLYNTAMLTQREQKRLEIKKRQVVKLIEDIGKCFGFELAEDKFRLKKDDQQNAMEVDKLNLILEVTVEKGPVVKLIEDSGKCSEFELAEDKFRLKKDDQQNAVEVDKLNMILEVIKETPNLKARFFFVIIVAFNSTFYAIARVIKIFL